MSTLCFLCGNQEGVKQWMSRPLCQGHMHPHAHRQNCKSEVAVAEHTGHVSVLENAGACIMSMRKKLANDMLHKADMRVIQPCSIFHCRILLRLKCPQAQEIVLSCACTWL
eukprot:630548-Pelagomonas_calceolata.AAC.2